MEKGQRGRTASDNTDKISKKYGCCASCSFSPTGSRLGGLGIIFSLHPVNDITRVTERVRDRCLLSLLQSQAHIYEAVAISRPTFHL